MLNSLKEAYNKRTYQNDVGSTAQILVFKFIGKTCWLFQLAKFGLFT